ncbi:MAG: restriction endonuclease subunit S [Lachnospiraceae bacterium]|nr:restriction endonuclease subunit S [Lachnospiraceae bacterium]
MVKDVIKLGDVATYINGYAFKPEDRGEVGLPIIRIQDLTGNAYDLGFYDGEYPEKIEINDGDVLISWSASLGVYIWNRGKALLNQHIFKVVFDKVDIDKNYFVYAVRQKLDEMGMKTHGATMKHIVKKDFDATLIPYPSLNKQAEIATNLNIVFRVIEARKQEIQLLDDLIKARFVEMFVDKGYPLVALDDLAMGKGEYGAQSASIEYDPMRPRYVRITDINDDGTLNDDVVSSANVEDDEQYKLSYGDFMFARMGATVGKTYAYKSGNQIFAGYLIRYKLNLGKIMPEYLYTYTKLDEYKNWVVLNQSGAAQPGINAKKYGSLQIPVAPLEEQRKFANFVHQVDKSKVAVQKALEETQLLFDSMMQKYFG